MSKKKKRRKNQTYLISASIILAVSLILLLVLVINETADTKQTLKEEIMQEADIGTEENATEIILPQQADNEIPPVDNAIAMQTDIETDTETEEIMSEEEILQIETAKILEAMTLEEKVAQMFMITPEALTGYSTVTAASDVTRQALMTYPVGGIILFKQNIVNPEQLIEMTENMQKYAQEISGVPMFLSIDEEGGKVTRIAGNENFDVPQVSDMREIGTTQDAGYAYSAGKSIGGYLKEYGLNVDFAPVADVLTNEQNELLKNRSFGMDAVLVSEMSQAYVQGLNENGVYGCLKHFPGHGGTAGDTHKGYAYTTRTLAEIQKEELVPFRDGIENGINFIMVSHISAENLAKDDTPASLSYAIITELLREQMNYEGIVITDAMNMGAIANAYNSASSAVKAIQAGADIVLMPVDFQSAYQGVIDAVLKGEISEDRINASLERIIKIKLKM